MPTQPPEVCLFDGFLESERDAALAALSDWLRIPSISAQPVHAELWKRMPAAEELWRELAELR